MLDSVFSTLDALMDFLPAMVRVVFWGSFVGALSMRLYGWLSPQARIGELQTSSAEARRQMRAYNGTDVGVAWQLMSRSLGLALRQVGLVVGPTLVAAVPVLVVLAGLEAVYEQQLLLPAGPDWLRSWHTVFLAGLSAGAVAVKFVFRIH